MNSEKKQLLPFALAVLSAALGLIFIIVGLTTDIFVSALGYNPMRDEYMREFYSLLGYALRDNEYLFNILHIMIALYILSAMVTLVSVVLCIFYNNKITRITGIVSAGIVLCYMVFIIFEMILFALTAFNGEMLSCGGFFVIAGSLLCGFGGIFSAVCAKKHYKKQQQTGSDITV